MATENKLLTFSEKTLDRIVAFADIRGVMNNETIQNEGNGREMSQLNTLIWSGEKLSEYIKRRGFTSLDDAARHLSAFVPPGMALTRQHIHNWINGRNVPSMRYLPAFRYGLGIEDPVTELFVFRRPNA